MHPLAQKIKDRFPKDFLDAEEFRGDATVSVKPERIAEMARVLHDDGELAFDHLSDLFSVDFPERPDRFEVVYQLNSLQKNHRLRLKTRIAEEPCEIDSVSSVWRAAVFLEREVYDLMGIRFRNHPDLRRIFLPEDFDGYPLRKEYPVEGKGWRNTFDFLPTEEPRT